MDDMKSTLKPILKNMKKKLNKSILIRVTEEQKTYLNKVGNYSEFIRQCIDNEMNALTVVPAKPFRIYETTLDEDECLEYVLNQLDALNLPTDGIDWLFEKVKVGTYHKLDQFIIWLLKHEILYFYEIYQDYDIEDRDEEILKAVPYIKAAQHFFDVKCISLNKRSAFFAEIGHVQDIISML